MLNLGNNLNQLCGYGSFSNNLTRRNGLNSSLSSGSFGGGIFGNGLGFGGGLRGNGSMNRLGSNFGMQNNFSSLSRGLGQRSMLSPFAGSVNDLIPIYDSLGLQRGMGLSRNNFSALSTIRPLPNRLNTGLDPRLRDEIFQITVLPVSSRERFGRVEELTLTASFSYTIDDICNELAQIFRYTDQILVQLGNGDLLPINSFVNGEELYRSDAYSIVVYGD